MKSPLPAPHAFLAGLLAVVSLASAQDFAEFYPDGDFASAEVEYDGMDNRQAQFGLGNGHPQNYLSAPADQAQLDLWAANYGDITGNTLSRCSFEATMAAAFAADTGGVFGFEDASAIYNLAGDQDVDYFELVLGSGARVRVDPGAQHYVEGGANDGYKGRRSDGAAPDNRFDGTGPSPIEPGRPYPQFFRFSTFSGINSVGSASLREATSFDLDFDIADEVSVVGFAYINYNNFQNNQTERPNLRDYPNVHVFADWSNGVDTITEMACGFSSGSSGNDYYFGFRQPAAGYFLDSLRMYSIGNDARCFNGIDELGIAVGDGAAVEVPVEAPALTVTRPSAGTVQLDWNASDACWWYEIVAAEDLANPFAPLDPVYLIKGTGAAMSRQLSDPGTFPQRFYEVEVSD